MLQSVKASEPVRHILEKYATRELPLTKATASAVEDAAPILESEPRILFPQGRSPEAAAAGLLLLLGHWDEAHTAADEVESQDGFYWHAIAHRMEPDASNAGYWFRKVGEHPIFGELRERAAEILEQYDLRDWALRAKWDPNLFIEWCEEARSKPGSEKEKAAVSLQRAEWEALFFWCAS
jgi:hypothetical protein